MLDCYVEGKRKRALVEDATYLTFTSPWTNTDELPVSVKVEESWDWMGPVWKALGYGKGGVDKHF